MVLVVSSLSSSQPFFVLTPSLANYNRQISEPCLNIWLWRDRSFLFQKMRSLFYFSTGDRSFIFQVRRSLLYFPKKAIALLFQKSDRSFIPEKRSFSDLYWVDRYFILPERRSLFYSLIQNPCSFYSLIPNLSSGMVAINSIGFYKLLTCCQTRNKAIASNKKIAARSQKAERQFKLIKSIKNKPM